MHGINGYIYCNGPTLQMDPGEKRRVLIMGFGSEVDMHSPVFAGQSISTQGALLAPSFRAVDAADGLRALILTDRPYPFPPGTSIYSPGVMPATTFVTEVEAGSAGAWDYYCNILDHINAGMKGRLVVG
jgi:hypothetical protein